MAQPRDAFALESDVIPIPEPQRTTANAKAVNGFRIDSGADTSQAASTEGTH